MKPMKVAILGAGNIARKMAETMRALPDVQSYAVAARELSRAQAFAQEWGIEKAYGSYQEMLEDPEVELVYIATTTDAHAAHIKLCLAHGKHVLCEKSFCANAAQTREVLALGREKGLLVAEAIWPRYMPMAKMIRKICEDGTIGKVHSLSANLGYLIAHKERLASPALAGGALLDVGIYALTFAGMAFGTDVERLVTAATLNEQGVDAQSGTTMIYRDGRMAVLNCSMIARTDRFGMLHGDKGYAVVENVNNPAWIKVFEERGENGEHLYVQTAQYDAPPQITGFEYQLQAAVDAIRAGRTECPEMPHSEILRVMELMDEMRTQWGVKFPFE